MAKKPVCVIGLGLIGGSVMRAATSAGREVFGYNRSPAGADAARADGFDASADLDETLTRAAGTGALIVLAVPMPALPAMLRRVDAVAPQCPLTDVTSVKQAVLDEVRTAGLQDRFVGGHPMTGTAFSGWHATDVNLFVGTPWVLSVDDHVDSHVWVEAMTLALDCGAFVVPALSEEHDLAAATISHLPHLFAEALATTAGAVPLSFALAAGSFRDGTRVAATAPDLVRAMCEANADQLVPVLNQALRLLTDARDHLASGRPLSNLVDAGHAARVRYDTFSRPSIDGTVVGADGWRAELVAAGRAGGVIRSALPSLDSRAGTPPGQR